MISTLHIKNIGIIDDLSIDFNEGLNILTGETGAGKTLIIQSLEIISGGRFSKEIIRKGENYSLVEASIYLPESEISEDGNIIISREIYSNGRNTCKINGKLVTVSELKKVMSKIIDIHGQHDNQNLLDNSNHISYLDDFAGKEIHPIKAQYSELFDEYNKIKNELENNYGNETEKERKLDLLKYQLNEIETANLKETEEIELNEKHTAMVNSEKLKENLQIIDDNLNNNAIEGISNAIRCFEKIENCGEIYKEKLAELKNIYYEIQETSRDIYSLKEDAEYDPYQMQEIERRLDTIFTMKRKYGNSIIEILEYKEQLKNEIELIENADEINNTLKIKLKDIEAKMDKLCLEMSNIRKKYATILNEKINNELKSLEMVNAKFNVNVNKIENQKYNKNGLDEVIFMICTNIGEEEKELTKIASGGEMSRIMLAIKTVIANTDKVGILIFDEIDTGISGKAAKAVADKMKLIAKNHQIICITHLATIAAKGDYNYYIFKQINNGKTTTNVELLNEEKTIQEIARISNGEITKVAIQNAEELRKLACAV